MSTLRQIRLDGVRELTRRTQRHGHTSRHADRSQCSFSYIDSNQHAGWLSGVGVHPIAHAVHSFHGWRGHSMRAMSDCDDWGGSKSGLRRAWHMLRRCVAPIGIGPTRSW
eukprot:gene16766-biopygen6785